MWTDILPLILFVCLGIVVLVVFEIRARKAKKEQEKAGIESQETIVETESSDDGC